MPRRFGWRRAVLWAVAALAALSLLPGNASATHRGVGVVDEVLLELTYQASSLPGAPGQLTARLKVEGSPLAGMPVEFWREVDFLGPQRIVLGTVTTGANGTASVPLTLSESPLRVGARFAGDPEYLAAEETTEIGSAGSTPTGSPVPTGNAGGANLDVVASVMPPLLALTVLVIWMLLIGVTVAAVLAVRRERSPLAATRKERM